ncbi:NlpC/P60 family protein [Streptomyces sp. NPDC047022]|uniref:C40 family peptidase n=1 Tax=Streptomyces sp. NPDC047022 TaxID=3155737 RepID=UPI0033DC7F42
MSGRLLRLVCTAAMTASTLLAPAPAVATPSAPPAPDPSPAPSTGPTGQTGTRSIGSLLTDLQQRYRQVEQAAELYDATTQTLKKKQAEVDRLDRSLAGTRLALQSSRSEVGRLARQQYQSSSGAISPYLRLLLARDPQHALDQGHVIAQLTRERLGSVRQLTGAEQQADALARQARKALDDEQTLAGRQQKNRDTVEQQLKDIEKLLASLTPEQLAALDEFENDGTTAAQRSLVSSGALNDDGRPPSAEGVRALRYAVEQIGKPYRWGAQGPASYDCSGLTSQAWQSAGRAIPRTSQEQWAELRHVPLTRLRPGDLVVYFPEATHVALYLGSGMVVQAPHPGTEIKVSPIAANPVLGAVRPDPGAQPLSTYVPPRLPRAVRSPAMKAGHESAASAS